MDPTTLERLRERLAHQYAALRTRAEFTGDPKERTQALGDAEYTLSTLRMFGGEAVTDAELMAAQAIEQLRGRE